MARERPEGPREASAACASTSFCAPSDLRTRESAPKYAHGYAKRHGGCSNRNELHACVGVPFPSIPAHRRWRRCIGAFGLLVARNLVIMHSYIRPAHPIPRPVDAADGRALRLQPAQPGRAAVKTTGAQKRAAVVRVACSGQADQKPASRTAGRSAERTCSHGPRCRMMQPSRRVAPLAPPSKDDVT